MSSAGDGGWLGFDVGGQSVKAGLFDSDGVLLASTRRPTGLEIELADLVAALDDAVAELTEVAPESTSVAPTIGVGIAGVMAADGILAGSPNLPRLVGEPVAPKLIEGLGRRVIVDNDANCAAVAEGGPGGAAAGRSHFLLVTLGSGIGSGLVLGGALHHGATGYACELGHMIVVHRGRTCGCGNPGCLEAYVSESAARAFVGELKGALKAEVEPLVAEHGYGFAQALFELASDASSPARSVVTTMVEMLGTGLASAINVLDVPLVVLGGGIAPDLLRYESDLRRSMDVSLFARSADGVEILAARRGAEAGAAGAARLAMLSAKPR